MKSFLKKSLISILIIFLLMNFTSSNFINICYADEGEGFTLDSIFTGLIGLITWIPRALVMALLEGLNALLSGLGRLGLGEIDGYGVFDETIFLTPFHIFFNKIAILDVNFLKLTDVSGTVLTFRTAVAGWYYTMRVIASMILLVILVYIGIRMAISTVAKEQAEYKKMLVNWVVSLALLFLLHYIMLFIFACNDALVNALKNICSEIDLTGFIGELRGQALGLETSSAIAAIILYGIIIGQTISFLFAYVKRMLTVGFLIMIAPLITITYSIDKIGDGKAQALNTWLKEFSYNILIQPFHCILFASFANVAFEIIGVGTWTAGSSLAEMILAVACIQFIKTGEKLVKKIFGFEQASSLSDMAAGTAMAMAAMSKGGEVGKAIGTGAAKTKNFIANNSDKISKATKGLSSKVSSMTDKLATVDKDGNLTKRGHRIAEKKAEKRTQKQKENNPHLNEDKAYVDNYNKVEQEMKQKFQNKGESTRLKAERRERKASSKRNNAIDKKMEEKYGGKEGLEKFRNRATDEEWEKARQKAGESVDKEAAEKKQKKDERKEKVRNITGKAGNYLEKNGQKIASATMGAVTSLVGFGVGGSAGAIAAAKFGSGLVGGYLANTNKTLTKEVSGAAQAVANMNDDNENFDLKAKTYGLHATAQNGGFDKVEEKLDAILNAIQGLTGNQKANFKDAISMQLLTNPAGLDKAFLAGLADKYGVSDDHDVLKGMTQYTTLAADANYAKSITTATGAGRTIDDVAQAAIGGTVSKTVIVNADIDEAELARNIEATVTVDGGVDEREISHLNNKVQTVTNAVEDLSSAAQQNKAD